MTIASRHSLWNSYAYPWDYRIAYIHCIDYRCYILFPYSLVNAGTPEELAIIYSTDERLTGDKKFEGMHSIFGICAYGSKWRNWGFRAWGQSTATSTEIFKWTVSTPNGAILTNISTNTIVETIPPPAGFNPATDDCNSKYMTFQRNMYCSQQDWVNVSDIPSELENPILWMPIGSFGVSRTYWEANAQIAANSFELLGGNSEWTNHKIYDFYRKVNGKTTAHLIPCVMGGIAGMYDEIGRKFYSPTNPSYSFGAGPWIQDNGNTLYSPYGLVGWWDAEFNVGINQHSNQQNVVWKNLGDGGSTYDATGQVTEWKNKAARFDRTNQNCYQVGGYFIRDQLGKTGDYSYEVCFCPTNGYCLWNNDPQFSSYYASGLVGGHGSGACVVGGQSSNTGANFGYQGYDWLSTKAFIPNQLNHVAISHSYTTSSIKCFVNGQLVAESSNRQKPNSTLPFCIGTSYQKNMDRDYDGLIFCVRCYDRAISQQEVENNYACDVARFSSQI